MADIAVFHISHAMRRRAISILITGAVVLALASCVNLPRTAFTEKEQNAAEIPGMPDVRFYSDAPLPEIMRVMNGDAMMAAAQRNGGLDLLAVSGGAYDGAYGAGILNGWTKSGRRPQFVVVTGVSSGSLIAPLAFLGPDYDPQLKDAYTSGASDSIGDGTDSLLGVISEAGPRREALHALVARYVDYKLLRAVAAEHRRGRRLLVVTTNLDAQRAVVWNMGAIASSGGPHALELFRDVLTASCSIPGVFEPTRIRVRGNGREFEELHVDGGVTTNVFMLPDAMLGNADRDKIQGNMYVILNTRLTPEFQVVEAKVPDMLGRTVSTLLKAHTKMTVLASMEFAQSAGMGYNLTHMDMPLPKDFKPGFNADYMRSVYAIGYRRAAAGDFWRKSIATTGNKPLLSQLQ